MATADGSYQGSGVPYGGVKIKYKPTKPTVLDEIIEAASTPGGYSPPEMSMEEILGGGDSFATLYESAVKEKEAENPTTYDSPLEAQAAKERAYREQILRDQGRNFIDARKVLSEDKQLSSITEAARKKVAERHEAKRAQLRDRSLGKSKSPNDVVEMTDAEFLALTPAQRSAVDVNTMLYDAVQRDLKLGGSVEDAAPKYNERVEDVFGAQGSSDTYAPNTLAVLKRIGYDAENEKVNLDDFLGLKVAITERDLENIRPLNQEGPQFYGAGTTPRQYDRATLQQALVNDFAESMQKVTPSALLDAEGNPMPSYGTAGISQLQQRIATGEKHPLGFGTTKQDATWQKAFDLMSIPVDDAKRAQLLGAIRTSLGSDEEYQKFMGYAEARSRAAETYNLPLGVNPDYQYMEAKKFRDTFGFKY